MIKIILFGKVEKKTGHQDRSKIALRIEWEHSQHLKQTLSITPQPLKKIINFEIIELNSTQYPLGSMQNDKICYFCQQNIKVNQFSFLKHPELLKTEL